MSSILFPMLCLGGVLLLVAPLWGLEYYALKALRRRLRGGAYFAASLLVYLAPFGLALFLGALLSWVTMDGSWVWLGETLTINPRDEWAAGVLMLLMATWPLVFAYLAGGIVIWVMGLREGGKLEAAGVEAGPEEETPSAGPQG